MKPREDPWGDPSPSSSGSYGGQPPNEPRAIPYRGGPRDDFSPGSTRGVKGGPLGIDKHTQGDRIFK